MKVFPVDPINLFLCVGVALVFEILRIFISLLFAGERGLQIFTEQRLNVLADIATIKSEQLEFVKKTKLERRLIAVEKDIEKCKLSYAAAAPRWKRAFRIVRLVVYLTAMIHFTMDPLVLVDAALFWPLLPFTSTCSIALSAWTVLPITGFAARHFLRALLALLTTASVP